VHRPAVRFARVEKELDRLRAAGSSSDADAMEAQLQHFRNEFSAPDPRSSPDPSWTSSASSTGSGPS
jgi:hypothetical protein